MLQTVVEDYSQLDLVDLQTDLDPQKVTSCKVKGVLTPDLLLYQVREN